MKIKIYYMTGTGNTKRAAELFQLQLNSMGYQCEVINWVHNEFNSWDDADAFGFAHPVHTFREPTPFRKKIKALPKTLNKKIPVFLINCCNGVIGNSFYRVGKLLRKKGAIIIGTYTQYAHSNVLMWEKNLIESKTRHAENKDHLMLQFAKTLPELIEKKESVKIKHYIGTGILGRMVGNWQLRFGMIRGKIKVDKEKCTKCGICAKACMSQCIILNPFPEINMKKCVVCLGCLNLCPIDALDAKNTVGKERYRGPGKLKAIPL